ncbi:T9SS type A sorting domain-containing protein [Flavobacterium sp.]|uniref:T9SS type A sorting domain-containing protein n=1 Tax=Flavobacterium sp. TaxID=239 RepID=UPI00286B90BC|nr:T9SS type A sorting domain-containing protein [Flavobacterium sp.]
MKQHLFYALLLSTAITSAQSVVQSVNSASIITSSSSVSVGEIVVNPTNPNQPSSGLIGIVAQINHQLLEVPQFEVSQSIRVYPNPTQAMLYFETTENLSKETISIYDATGKLIVQKTIVDNHSLDLSALASGQYIIQFQNKKNKSIQIIKK